jgi:DinB superfamily
MFFRAGTSVDRVRRQLQDMRALADSPESALFTESRCSGWTPAEHMDHLIKVTASIVNRILQSDAPRGETTLSALGRIILAVGRIPRGRGKAPERLRGARVGAAELHAGLTKLEGKLDELTAPHLADTRGAIVPHPRFGGLLPSQAMRFAAVHNDHHLRIIAEILARK